MTVLLQGAASRGVRGLTQHAGSGLRLAVRSMCLCGRAIAKSRDHQPVGAHPLEEASLGYTGCRLGACMGSKGQRTVLQLCNFVQQTW